MLQEGNKIKINIGNDLIDATMLGSGGYSDVPLYWVEYYIDGMRKCTLFSEDDLFLWNRNRKCTCGSESVHYPYPPPGHAYHCEMLVI